MDCIKMLNKIKNLNKPAVIMISGFGGAGKSTYSKRLSADIDAPIIGIDSFFHSLEFEKYQYWNSIDYNRFEKEVLIPFISNSSTIKYGEFDWVLNRIEKTITVMPKGLIIVEGIGLFRPELMHYYAYSIWIDCPIEVAISRGAGRDRDEYGVNHDDLWHGIWKDNDLECYRAYEPSVKADCVIQYER